MSSIESIGNATLRDLGRDLDEGGLLAVSDGGFVVSADPSLVLLSDTEENDHERPQTERGSAAGTGQRTEGREGAASGATDSQSSFLGAELQYSSQNDVANVMSAYPGAQFYWLEDGFWVTTTSGLIEGAPRSAVFLTCVRLVSPAAVRSWGYWDGKIWIGPRHTNFPDGSICVFDPRDRTWQFGQSLVRLFDLYTIWALRQLHFMCFDRWPGRQSSCHPYENLLEVRPHELCGCDRNPSRMYKDCCQPNDLKLNRLASAVDFTLKFNGGIRHPPKPIHNFFLGNSALPSINDVFSGALS